jgi:sarcosine oxidase
MDSYDCIVAGVGGAGSSALMHLAARGCKVLGLDRFTPGHDRGSSHGDTRIIRMAYFEHPDYVPLLKRAHHLWGQLEEARSEKLRFETGLLQAGPAAGFIVEGVLRSAREHSLEVEELGAAEAAGRFNGVARGDSMEAVYEKGAGYLLVENCVRAHAEEAVRRGAQLETGVSILGWSEQENRVTVETDRGSFQAANLVITPGAWAPELLQTVGVPLEVRRKHLYWFRCPGEQYRDSSGFPSFVFETPGGFFYGFPSIDGESIKVARHCGGRLKKRILPRCVTSLETTCRESKKSSHVTRSVSTPAHPMNISSSEGTRGASASSLPQGSPATDSNSPACLEKCWPVCAQEKITAFRSASSMQAGKDCFRPEKPPGNRLFPAFLRSGGGGFL